MRGPWDDLSRVTDVMSFEGTAAQRRQHAVQVARVHVAGE